MSNQPSPFVSTFLTWIGLFMHRSMRSLVRYAREHGLSMSQIAALFQISNRGQLTISEFGDDLGVTSAAASQMLDRLVQQGLVLRSENPEDRREKQLVLSDLGQPCAARFCPHPPGLAGTPGGNPDDRGAGEGGGGFGNPY